MPARRFLRRETRWLFALSLVAVGFACGARSKRDMSMPPREVTYNDACALQDYFDQRAAAGLQAPAAADEMLATNAKGQTIGEGTYILKDPLARRRFGRLLREEYSGVDMKLVHAVESTDGRITVHVRWWDAGPIKRLRPDDDIVIVTADGESELPPNVCVSDFLFGDKVYAMRARYLRNEVDLATGKPMSAESIDALMSAANAPMTSTPPTNSAPPAPSSSTPPSPSTSAAPSSSSSAKPK